MIAAIAETTPSGRLFPNAKSMCFDDGAMELIEGVPTEYRTVEMVDPSTHPDFHIEWLMAGAEPNPELEEFVHVDNEAFGVSMQALSKISQATTLCLRQSGYAPLNPKMSPMDMALMDFVVGTGTFTSISMHRAEHKLPYFGPVSQ